MHPIVDHCWVSVADGDPALNQHRINVSRLLERGGDGTIGHLTCLITKQGRQTLQLIF